MEEKIKYLIWVNGILGSLEVIASSVDEAVKKLPFGSPEMIQYIEEVKVK